MDYMFDIDMIMENSNYLFMNYSMEKLEITNEQVINEAEKKMPKIIETIKNALVSFCNFLKSIPGRLKAFFSKIFNKSKAQDKVIEKLSIEAKKVVNNEDIASSPKVNPGKETADEELTRKAVDIVFRRAATVTRKAEESINNEKDDKNKIINLSDRTSGQIEKKVEVILINRKNVNTLMNDHERLLKDINKCGYIIDSLIKSIGTKKFSGKSRELTDVSAKVENKKSSATFLMKNMFTKEMVTSLSDIYTRIRSDATYINDIEKRVDSLRNKGTKMIESLIPDMDKAIKDFESATNAIYSMADGVANNDTYSSNKEMASTFSSNLRYMRQVLSDFVPTVSDNMRLVIKHKSVIIGYLTAITGNKSDAQAA